MGSCRASESTLAGCAAPRSRLLYHNARGNSTEVQTVVKHVTRLSGPKMREGEERGGEKGMAPGWEGVESGGRPRI